jgi:uncharacterized protein (TIGR02001 family)
MVDAGTASSAAVTKQTYATLALLGLAVCIAPRVGNATDVWGGSLAITSDYLVRGVSRSNNSAAVQADLHFATDAGFIAGVFASSVELYDGDPRNAEVSAFLGFAWAPSAAWHTKLLASYYSYPWNQQGRAYNYAELSVEATYDDWLDLALIYSPDAPRYEYDAGLTGVSAKSAEMNLRSPWWRRLAATAGVGYSQYAGAGGGGYVYYSAGGVLDLAPCSVSLSYVSTSAEAQSLFYAAAAHNRWTATLIWRF